VSDAEVEGDDGDNGDVGVDTYDVEGCVLGMWS
jgi:hypothetical protein